MTRKQRKLIGQIKELYEEHDHSESLLVYATRRNVLFGETYNGLWQHHDNLERGIIEAEAKLPHHIVEKLKRGEL